MAIASAKARNRISVTTRRAAGSYRPKPGADRMIRAVDYVVRMTTGTALRHTRIGDPVLL